MFSVIRTPKIYLPILSLTAISLPAHSELVALDDATLGQHTGQGVIEVSEVLAGEVAQPNGEDLSFTRITLGMDIDINANIDRLVLGEGERQDGIDNSGGTATADIDFANISLGHIDENGVLHDFSVVDPYFEFARNDDGELVGFRMGFGEVNGSISMEINTLSGDVQAVGELGFLDLNSYANNIREDEITDALLGLGFDLGNFEHMKFTDTNNMYLGLQSQAINYPKVGDGPQGTAQAGFWMNLQDGVTSPDLALTGFIDVANERLNNHYNGYSFGQPAAQSALWN